MALPTNRPTDLAVVPIRITDVATTNAHYGVAPVKGWVKRLFTVCEGTTNGAPVITANVAGTDLSQTLTIASGGGAGDVDSVEFTPAAAAYVNEGGYIKLTSDGAGSTTVVVNAYVVIEQG